MTAFLKDRTRRLGLAALAALTLCTALSVAQAQAPTSSGPTVAALPLENRDDGQAFFAEGMADEIAAALARVPGLDVVARSSSFQLRSGNSDLKSVGQSLNASYLVQGTAQLAGDRARFHVRLVKASDGTELWSENFYTALVNVFDLEREIATRIAAALAVPVRPGDELVPNRIRDTEAYLDFLRAKVTARPRGGAQDRRAHGPAQRCARQACHHA